MVTMQMYIKKEKLQNFIEKNICMLMNSINATVFARLKDRCYHNHMQIKRNVRKRPCGACLL